MSGCAGCETPGVSYDIWLEADLAGEKRARLDGDEPGNITYNVDPMFALALGGESGDGIQNGRELLLDRKDPALKRFIDRPAAEAIGPLTSAVASMEGNPDTYRALNPENGWGDYEGALDYLRRFLAACEAHPNAVIAGWL
jgi:hypothetical protein